jgi:hypothetical protein
MVIGLPQVMQNLAPVTLVVPHRGQTEDVDKSIFGQSDPAISASYLTENYKLSWRQEKATGENKER